MSSHLSRSAALHLWRALSSSSEVWIQVKLKPEKLNLSWLVLKISTERQSTKKGKRYEQVHSCLFQQGKLARIEPGFASGSWRLCGHSSNVLISLETSMFG